MTLKEAVELQKEPLLQSLAESIRIRSVQEPPADGAPYGPNVRKCLDHALAVSKGLGFRTTDLDHQMGWCEFGEGDEMIAVLGHLDVVPEGEGWTFDPFGGEIRDGKIFGRGSMDDKGPGMSANPTVTGNLLIHTFHCRLKSHSRKRFWDYDTFVV